MWANINPATKEYHSFDIVDTYNNYRMFVSPEETIGQPSINAIEGMACGCAYVGRDDPMYTDLGFTKGVHYVAYDGTIEDLARVIGYYQSRPDELARIAEAGRALVTERFRPDRALQAFVKNLEIL
jgi:glycosyltransferase involved in cell wall biosynthesis